MYQERAGSGTGQREALDCDTVTIRVYSICTGEIYHFTSFSLKLKLNFVIEIHKGKHNQKVSPFMTNSACTRRLQCQGKDNEEV